MLFILSAKTSTDTKHAWLHGLLIKEINLRFGTCLQKQQAYYKTRLHLKELKSL